MRRVCFLFLALFVIVGLTDIQKTNALLLLQDPIPPQEEKKKDEKKKEEPKISGELGTETNPVKCDFPKGERQYLSRLRCSDGKAPTFSRIGSFGLGPYGHIIDGYRVQCEGKDEVRVFMDMYFKDYVEKEAVPGFTIVEE